MTQQFDDLALFDQLPTGTVGQDCLADDNVEAQSRLFFDLREAARAARISTDDVASSLGVDEQMASAVLDGAVDLTLSDLRQVLFAVDAFVRYTVMPRYAVQMDEALRSLANHHTDAWEDGIDWKDLRVH